MMTKGGVGTRHGFSGDEVNAQYIEHCIAYSSRQSKSSPKWLKSLLFYSTHAQIPQTTIRARFPLSFYIRAKITLHPHSPPSNPQLIIYPKIAPPPPSLTGLWYKTPPSRWGFRSVQGSNRSSYGYCFRVRRVASVWPWYRNGD